MRSHKLFFTTASFFFLNTPLLIGFLFISALLFSSGSFADEEKLWSLSVFAAKKSNDTLGETVVFDAHFPSNQNFISIALAKKIGSYKKFLQLLCRR